MTWRRNFCGGKNRKGEPCGNPSPDGRGGLCWVHRRQAEERARDRRQAIKAAGLVEWYCHTCHKTHLHTPADRDAHREEIRAAEWAAVRQPDGCVGGHSPSLVDCELGADWP